MTLRDQIARLEHLLARRRAKPLDAVRVALECAEMDLTIDCGDPAKTQKQLDRAARLEHALETGDLSGLVKDDLKITPPAEAGTL